MLSENCHHYWLMKLVLMILLLVAVFHRQSVHKEQTLHTLFASSNLPPTFFLPFLD
ncbi:hypothetical protein PGB90_003920 [Kerria lacca]